MRSLEHVASIVLRVPAAPAAKSRLLRNTPNRWARVLALLVAIGMVVLSPRMVTAGLLDGLVGYWSFDNSGNLGQDKSGNGYAGTAQGNASFLSGGVLGGGALNLDGSGDFMQLPNMASNFSNSASLSVWINLNNATPSDGSRTGFMDFDNGSNSHYTWVNGLTYMGLFRNSGRFDNIAMSGAVDRGNWHLMTVVSDPTEGYKIYQNDIQVFSTSQPGFGVEGFRLGTQNGYWLDGQIDEAGLWNRALTASDVSALYNGGAGLNFFLSAGPTLFWNGTSGNWADDVWLNDVPTVGLNQNTHPQNVSSVVNPAVITEGTVSVTSDQQAYSLNMDTGSGGSGGRPGNGTLNINGGTLLVRTDTTISNTSSVNISTGATLETTGILAVGAGTTFSSSGTVNADTLAGSGTVTLNTGGSLNVGSGGSLGAVNVAGNASLGGAGSVSLGQLSIAADKTLTKMGAGSATLTLLTLAGNATIDVSGSGAVTAPDLNLSSGSTLIKQGVGKLTFNGNAHSVPLGSTVNVAGGELAMKSDTNPLGLGSLTLSGGTFSVGSATAGTPALNGPAGLSAHYDASLGVTTDGAGVVSWADQSGNGHTAVRAGNNAQLQAGQINGLPTIELNNAWLDINSNISEKQAYVVFRSDNGTTFGPDWSSPWGQQNGRHWMMQPGTTQFWTDGGWDQPPLAVSHNGAVIASSPFALTNVNQFMVLKVNERVDDNTFMRIGANGGWTNGRWDVGEILIYDRVLSVNEENSIGGYLAQKYGISTSYSGSIGAPLDMTATNPTVTAGSTGSGLNATSVVNWGALDVGANADLTLSGSKQTFTGTALGNGSTLAVGTGGADLANVTMNNLATISSLGSVTMASVTMPSGSTLAKTGSGTLDIASVTTTGNATIDASGGATNVTDLTLAGSSTFFKSGSGKLTVAPGGLTINNTNTVQVNGGELFVHSASNPLSGAALNLNGGTFSVQGAATIGEANGLFAQVFDQAYNPATQLSFHNPASLLTQTGAATAVDTGLGNSNGPGINYNGNFHVLFPPSIPGGTEQFMVTWDGFINPTVTGTYNINSYWADDAYSVYVDLNQNSLFESNEKRSEAGTGGGANGAFTLTAGQQYRVAFGFAENGGGENVGYQFSTPVAGFTNVNPSAQPGLWTHVSTVVGAIDMTDSPVSVTGNATLNAVTDSTAAFGALSFDANNKTLTTTGAPGGMTFTGTSFDASVTAAGIETETSTNLGSINDAGPASLTLTKTGSADLTLNQAGSLAATTTLEVREGRMNVDYTTVNPTGSAKFLLSGGTLAAQGAGLNLTTLTVDNASANGLFASVFYQAYNPNQQLRFENPASLLTQTGAATAVDTGLGNSNGPGINYNGNFEQLFPPSLQRTEQFMVTWDGHLTAPDTGNYQLYSYWSDDAYSVYVDLNQDGVFTANEMRWEGGTGGGAQGGFSLNAGEQYRVAFGFAENGGGENVGFHIDGPNGLNANVNPAAQTGLWSHQSTSTLELNDSATSNLQELVLKNGSLRITGGSLLTVDQASFAVGASSTVGLITETKTILTDVSGLDGNNQTVKFTKSGAADLILNKAGTELGSATISLAQGRLIGVAGAGGNPFGAATISVTSGELVLASDNGSDRTYDNALVVKGNSTLTAGAGGQGFIGATITLGSAGNGLAINSGTLTARTQDDYDLHIAGPVTGAGGLTVASELTTLGTVNVGTLNVNAQLNAAKSIAATGTLDINAALNRTGSGADGNVSAGTLLLRTGTLEMAAGQTLAVSSSASVKSGATLRLDGSMTGAGGLTVESGGTLTGIGNIANAVTIQSGALLAPGNSGPGTLTTGNFTLNSGGIFDWGLGATGDKISVNGNLTLDSGWTFRLNDNGTPLTLGDQLLFTYTGTRSIGLVNFDKSLVASMSNWHTDAIEIFDNGSGSVFLRNLVVTGPAAGNLTWDGATADWSDGAGTDSHWNGGTVDQIPSLTYTATVNSGKATVGTANAAAHTLTLGGGEVEIATGRSLNVTDNVNVNNGTLDIQGNLAVNVNVDVAPAGTLTVAGSGNIQALQLNTSGSTTLEAGSTSNLPKLNVSGGTTTVNSSTLTVPEVNVSAGNLAVNADMPVQRLNITAAGTVNTSATSDVVVSEKMKLTDTEYSINSGNTFKAGGAITSSAAERLTLTGGTLTVGEPFSLPAGLEAHYDASTLSLANGAAVTAWADISGNGRDLVTYQGTPNFKTNAINGLPAVNFRDESLQNSVASPFFAKDVYLVFRSDSGNTNFGPDWGAPIGVKDGDDNNRTWMFQPGEDRFWDQELPSAVTLNGVAKTSANNWELGTDVSQFMLLKVTAGPNNGTQIREYIVGSRTDAWSNSYFDTAEILAFDHALSAAEENDLGGYLASKYGLTTAYTGNLLSPLNLTGTNVAVEQSTTLNAQATTAAFGGLTLAGGTLTTQGASQGMTFTDTTIAAAAVGINTQTDTSSGPINGGGLGATITKTGAADLVVQGAGSNLAGATFDVQAGRLIGVHGSNPFGAAGLKLSGGEAVLASAGGNVTYDNAVQVTADSKLTVGAGGGHGQSGPLDVTLGNAATGIALTSGKLTVETTDNYRLVVPGTVAGSGSIDIVGGSVKVNQGITAGAVSVASTMLETTGHITATTGDVKLSGGTLRTSGNVTISANSGEVKVTNNANLNVTGGHLILDNLGGGSPPAGLVAHFDASTLGLSNGATVNSWTNLAGPNYNLDLRDNTPEFVTNRLNGQPVVRFLGSDRLKMSQNIDAALTSQEYTIFSVARYSPDGGTRQRVLDSQDHNWLFGFWGNGTVRWHADGWIHEPGGITDTNWHLHAGTLDNAGDPRGNFWNNGVQVAFNSTGSSNGWPNRGPGRIVFGGNGEWSDSEIAEVLLFNGVLTAEELNNVGGYLNSKYGLGFTGYTGGFGTTFGDVTMAAGSQLSLNSDGSGEAAFGSIVAGHNATINGSVIAKGNVEVGNSVGTLHVNGNYTQGGGSTYKWEVAAAQADKIVASGNVDASASQWNLQITALGPAVNMNGRVLMSGTSASLTPLGVSVSLTDNLYQDLYDVSGASLTVQNGGQDIVLDNVQTDTTVAQSSGSWGAIGWSTGTPAAPKAAVVDAGRAVTLDTNGDTRAVVLDNGNLEVTSGNTLTVHAGNVRIGDNATLKVSGTVAVGSNDVVVYDGGTLHLNDGGTIGSGVDLKAGGTLKSTGTQNMPDNITIDPASTIHVAGGTFRVAGGGGMPTGNVLWLDAGDMQGNGTATVNGTPVTTWTDKSGAGNNATNGGNPTTIVFGNGTSAVRLDGDDWIRTTMSIDSNTRPNVTIFAVYDYRQQSGDDSLWGQEDGGWDRFTLLAHGVGPGVSHGNGMFNISEMGQTGIGFVINEIQMAEGVTNGSHVLINGNTPANNGGIFTINGSCCGPGNSFAIGAQNANSGAWTTIMDVSEFLVFDRVLTEEEQNDVGGYLADKYGLTTGYTGGFGVKLGNVVVDAGATLLNTGGGALEIQQLSGSGTVASNVLLGSLLSPGNSIGTLDIDGNLTLDTGTVYDWEMDSAIVGDYDSVAVAGTLEFSGDWLLKLLDDGLNEEIFASDKFYLFTGLDFTGGDLGIWSIDGSLVGPGWDVTGAMIGGDANGVYLTGLVVAASAEDGPSAVPEPSTYALAALGLLGLGFFALRKKFRSA